MSNITGTVRAIPANANNPTIENVVLVAAVETEIVFPAATRSFLMRAREYTNTRIALAPGETSTDYFTIPPGATLNEDSLDFTGSLWLRADIDTIIELFIWN